jgi:hypothetical protein
VLCALAPRAWQSLEPLRLGLPDLRSRQQVARAPKKEPDAASGKSQVAPQSRPLSEMLPPPKTREIHPPVGDRFEPDSLPTTDSRPSAAAVPLAPPLPPAPSSAAKPAEPPPPEVQSQAAEVPKEPRPFLPASTGCWPYSTVLANGLHELSHFPETRTWALALRDELDAVGRITVLSAPDFQTRLDSMKQLVQLADEVDRRLDALAVRKKLRRTVYDLVKRLDLWKRVYEIARRGDPLRDVQGGDASMRDVLTAVEERLRPLHDAQAWRTFLLLDETWRLSQSDHSPVSQQEVASVVLTRLDSPQLTDVQQRFLAAQEFQSLRWQHRLWVSQPVDYPQLLELLERHEQWGRDQDEAAIAEQARMLLWSTDEARVELGEMLQAHWRNANVRVAVSGALINRLLPPPPPRTLEPVNDRIRGARVFGRSEAETEGLFVRLLPDRTRLRLGLEARGLVASETAAASGPVRIFNQGLARFRVRKALVIDRRGVRAERAEGEADSNTVMTGLETEYDGYPLVGALVRSIALQQAESESGPAEWEVEQKLAARASRRLDDAVQRKLINAEARFQQKVLLPLRRLDLDPVPIEMQTTAERLIVRYRLAGDDQLAAYTPRPQAPADSLISLQVHESVVNNSASKVGLAGRRASLEEHFKALAAAVGKPDAEVPEEMPQGITVEFAPHDPLKIEFVDGRVLVTMRFAEISAKGGGRWTNFWVRGEYVPQLDGLKATLAREGIVYLGSLEGHPRLTLGERFALRGIFTKVLSKKRKLNLTPEAIQTNEKLQDLCISQFAVEDGWIGAALGPKPVRRHLGDRGEVGRIEAPGATR